MKIYQLLVLLLFHGHLYSLTDPVTKTIPEPRSGYSLSYDDHNNRVLLFGGQDTSDDFLGDTFSWSEKTGWQKIVVKGPAPRINSSMTYCGEMEGMLLFGGLTDNGPTNDLWLFKDNEWHEISTEVKPPSRQLGTIAYNEHEKKAILFGGKDKDNKRLADCWAFDGNKWIELKPDPSARSSHSMLYYPKNKSILVYGGYDGEMRGDTWELKMDRWERVESMRGPKRIHSSLVFDLELERILLFGGFGDKGRTNELWAFENNKWTKLSIETPLAARAEHECTYLPEVGLFVFGGVLGEDPRKRDRGNDTWVFNGTWEEKF